MHAAKVECGAVAGVDICAVNCSMHFVVPLQGTEGPEGGRGQGLLSGVTVIRTGSLFQMMDKMMLPLGMRIKKYFREIGSFTSPHSPWEWEQNHDLCQELECPTAMSLPTSLATFQAQVL